MALFIDDSYLKENYPIPFTVDATRLRAVINITQKTFMRDMLGDSLYESFDLFIEQGEPKDNSMLYIADDVKMLECLYVAKGLWTSYYTGEDISTRDMNIDYIKGNIKLYEQILARKIESVDELKNIADTESANKANTDESSYNSIYYPSSEVDVYTPTDLPVTILSFTGSGLYKVGTTNDITLNWEIDGLVKSLYIVVNGLKKALDIKDRQYVAKGISSDSVFELIVNGDSVKQYAKFVYPSYYGTIDLSIDSIEPSDVITGKEAIIDANKFSAIFNTYFNTIFFAYPEQYGILKYIYDNNGFDCISDFKYKLVDINGISYYIYVKTTNATLNNFKYNFE